MKMVVSPAGFEPAFIALEVRCVVLLRHGLTNLYRADRPSRRRAAPGCLRLKFDFFPMVTPEVARRVGIEPTTTRLTAVRSTN